MPLFKLFSLFVKKQTKKQTKENKAHPGYEKKPFETELSL